MKRVLLVALVVLNLGLLALVLDVTVPRVQAQARGNVDYLACTGKIGGNSAAIYVIDLSKGRMLAWRFDDNAKKMAPTARGIDLTRDFKSK